MYISGNTTCGLTRVPVLPTDQLYHLVTCGKGNTTPCGLIMVPVIPTDKLYFIVTCGAGAGGFVVAVRYTRAACHNTGVGNGTHVVTQLALVTTVTWLTPGV